MEKKDAAVYFTLNPNLTKELVGSTGQWVGSLKTLHGGPMSIWPAITAIPPWEWQPP